MRQTANTIVPVQPPLSNRWSPRVLDRDQQVGDDDMAAPQKAAGDPAALAAAGNAAGLRDRGNVLGLTQVHAVLIWLPCDLCLCKIH